MTTMRQLLIAALLAFSAATVEAAPAPSVLDIKHSLRDDNVRPPESFETQSRVLEENFFLRNYTDARPNSTEIRLGNAEEYTRKLAELNPGIEMPYNPVVGKLIDMYLGKRRSLVSNMLALHDYYGDIFIEELEKEGLPLELQYLPVIESAINPNAVSRAGATGLWQFMPATAKGLGMEVSTLVDERRDARESSRNAARYLKQLYNIYGDWSLAIAAYNCGPGNVNKARRRAGEASSDFWEIYNFLPTETRGYVPAFIAANYVMNYHDDYGIHRPVIKRPLITDTGEVRERVHFNQIANVLNIPIDEIRMLNPQYRKDVIPGSPTRPYLLTLPSQQVLSYISSRDEILAYESEKYTPRSTVELGRNKNKNKEEEPAGQQPVEQPAEQPAPNQPSQQPVVADAVNKLTHTVGRGEDLGSIAKQYGVSATDIKKWNNLRRGKVREGEQLVIEVRQRNTVAAVNTRASKANSSEVPARQTKPAAQASRNENASVPERTRNRYSSSSTTAQSRAVPQRNSEKYKNKKQEAAKQQAAKAKKQKPVEHTVKSGESLEKIAKRYGTTVDALQKANGFKKGQTNLQIDQKLKVPKANANANAKNSKNAKAEKNQKNSKNAKADKNTKSSKNKKETAKSSKKSAKETKSTSKKSTKKKK